MEQRQTGDARLVPREVMQIALLEQQLQQTRLDMHELADRLTRTDTRLDNTNDRLQTVIDKLNEFKGGRFAIAALASFATGLITVAIAVAAHVHFT